MSNDLPPILKSILTPALWFVCKLTMPLSTPTAVKKPWIMGYANESKHFQ